MARYEIINGRIVLIEDRFNPFEHRDDYEVYGSDELTFFDSGKRSQGDTSQFFGF